MAISTPNVGPSAAVETNRLLGEVIKLLSQMTAAHKSATAASLASGIIAASGRPHSIADALAVYGGVTFALHPSPGHGHYEAWAADKETNMKKVHV